MKQVPNNSIEYGFCIDTVNLNGETFKLYEYDEGAYMLSSDTDVLYKCVEGEGFDFTDSPMYVNEFNEWEEQ